MNIPEDLKYTTEHEWARYEGNHLIRIGITDHAQDTLGDVVFVELPEVGTELEANGNFGVVESVKAVSDLFSPCAGKVADVNSSLLDTPELINQDAYQAWLIVIEVQDLSEFEQLMSAQAYQNLLAQEAT